MLPARFDAWLVPSPYTAGFAQQRLPDGQSGADPYGPLSAGERELSALPAPIDQARGANEPTGPLSIWSAMSDIMEQPAARDKGLGFASAEQLHALTP